MHGLSKVRNRLSNDKFLRRRLNVRTAELPHFFVIEIDFLYLTSEFLLYVSERSEDRGLVQRRLSRNLKNNF